MKPFFALSLALAMLLSLSYISEKHIWHDCSSGLHSCSAAENSIEIIQVDGTHLSIIGHGDASLNYVTTIDGYTLIKENGIYYYAVSSNNGKLVSSAIKAHNKKERTTSEIAFLGQIEKGNKVSNSIGEATRNKYESEIEDSGNARFPSTGEQNLLVLLIEYPDIPKVYSEGNFDDMMNAPNYNNKGSFKDYFRKNSFENLDLTIDVSQWFVSEEGYAHYGNMNGIGAAMELVAEAIDAAEDSGIDFSKYDNDNDGEVDGVMIIHSGPGAEVGAQNQYVWSHRSRLNPTHRRNYDGVMIRDYIINPETRPWGMVGIGVLCHEFGHLLGLPDLYDIDNSSSGLGNWCLMSKGSWLDNERTPANLSAWSKKQQGWIEPTIIEDGWHNVTPADFTNNCYQINTTDESEYYLIENKQAIGNDKFLPGTGLAIWHIDEDKITGSNYLNIDETHRAIDLEEADGLFQLDNGTNNGNNGDLFPGNTNNTVFDGNSSPTSNTYANQDAEVSITNININGDNVSFILNGDGTLPCNINSITRAAALNCGNGNFDLEMTVDYIYPATDKKLFVNGKSFDLTGSPQKVILNDLQANGATVNIEAKIGEDDSCIFEQPNFFVAPTAYEINYTQTTCNPNEVGIFGSYLSSASGCDSVVITNVTLLENSISTFTETTCNPLLAGIDTLVFNIGGGCDSTVILRTDYIDITPAFQYEKDGFQVSFINQTFNANDFLWNFGDGRTSTETHPIYKYSSEGNYKVTLTAKRGSCIGQTFDTISIEQKVITSSIDNQLENLNLNIYPNPASDLLNIAFANQINDDITMRLINLQGKEIIRRQIESYATNISLDLSTIASGSYIITFETEQNQIQKKIIKL